MLILKIFIRALGLTFNLQKIWAKFSKFPTAAPICTTGPKKSLIFFKNLLKIEKKLFIFGQNLLKIALKKSVGCLRLSSSSLHCATTTALQKRPHRRFSSSVLRKMALKRIKQELAELNREPIMGCTAAPIDGGRDLYHWTATIQGPPGSPYEGGTFNMDIVFHRDYPFTPQIVKFETPVFHLNVTKQGVLFMDILLRQNWVPTLTISKGESDAGKSGQNTDKISKFVFTTKQFSSKKFMGVKLHKSQKERS